MQQFLENMVTAVVGESSSGELQFSRKRHRVASYILEPLVLYLHLFVVKN